MPDVRVPYGEPGDLKSKTVDEKSYDEGPRDDKGDLIDPSFDKLDKNEKLAAWIDHFNKATGVMDARALKAARAAAGMAAPKTPEYVGFRTLKYRRGETIVSSEQYNRGPVDATGRIDPNFSSLSDNQKEAGWAAADDIPQISQPEVDEADARSDFHGSDMFDPIPLGHPDVAMWEREYLEAQAQRKKGWFQKTRQRLGIGRADTLAVATLSTLKSKGR
jgi:hypothetical protein